MKMFQRITLGSLLLGCALSVQPATKATAQSVDPDLAEFAKSLPEVVLREIARNPDQYLQLISREIFANSPDGIATRARAELSDSRNLANARANAIMQILRYDLDGDGTVTATEVERLLPIQQARESALISVKLIEVDSNADQRLTFSEILTAAQTEVEQSDRSRARQSIDKIMAFDVNTDGQVDLAEVARVLAAIDPADLENLGPASPARPQPAQTCTAPSPSSEAEVVFLSGYGGAALSTLAVSGQDRETSVATVTITEGTAPLYIFATALESVVWKFDGATDRVQRLVVQPRNTSTGPGAAVAGIPSEYISFVAPQSCVSRYVTSQTAEANAQMAPLSQHLGKPFDHVVVGYNISNFQVPPSPQATPTDAAQSSPYRATMTFSLGEQNYELSGAGMTLAGQDELNTEAQERTTLSPIRSMMRFYPMGLIAFSPDDVHASAPVGPYEVLPQQAGLLQLIADGSLEYQSDGAYYIKEPIARFPAGLNGAHSVRFVLASGVPMPAGSPGHSGVVSEETGECLVGHRCR